MLKGLLSAFSAFFSVIPHLFKGKKKVFFLIPGFAGLLFSILYAYGAYTFAPQVGEALIDFLSWRETSDYQTYLASTFAWISLIAIYLLLFKYVVLIISAPFMSFYSESIEAELSPKAKASTWSWKNIMVDIWRSLRINLMNFIRELFLLLSLLLLSLIPAVSPFSSFLIVLVSAYYIGFGHMDYTLERHLNYKDTIQFVRDNRGVALGIGLGYLIIYALPIAGFFLATPFATAAATQATVGKLNASSS
jgi:CysZ protein